MWHIAKRELYDNLNSLRFALTTVLLLALMMVNAVKHLREHPKRVQKYRDAVAESLSRLTSHADVSLYRLAQQGPGTLYKKPSPLHFCAEGGETFLPDRIEGGTRSRTNLWELEYPDTNINMMNVGPDVSQVDWTFIVGYVLSLIALIFTFDAISGERERGTLRLMLANSIPRHTVLIGKFLGALISMNISFILAVLVNLLMISTSSAVHLNAQAWSRLGIIFFIALLYTCLFLALGLLVSARVQQSAVSLVILLLTWVTFVVFMPSTLASIARGFSSSISRDEYWRQYGEIDAVRWSEYKIWMRSDQLDERTLTKKSEYYTKGAARAERLYKGHLTFKISQVQRARAITSISPAVLLQHLLESFAGTGLDRHQQFIENVQRYAREYREFVVDMDRGDPASRHIMGVREGMSQKPINPEAVPKFEDTFNLGKDFNTAATELLLLTLFIVVLLAGAYLAFVRVEI